MKNMSCADCPFIVRKSLEAVPGVTKAVVSYKDKIAASGISFRAAELMVMRHRTLIVIRPRRRRTCSALLHDTAPRRRVRGRGTHSLARQSLALVGFGLYRRECVSGMTDG